MERLSLFRGALGLRSLLLEPLGVSFVKSFKCESTDWWEKGQHRENSLKKSCLAVLRHLCF